MIALGPAETADTKCPQRATNMRQQILALILLFASYGGSSKVRVVTKEELATKTSKHGAVIWLAIMGEVYDVSNGTEYYSEGNGYSVFAGREANVPFITGRFSEEEANQSVEELKPEEIGSLDHWRDFYATEEKYSFVGFLDGDFYDKDGNPTELNKRVQAIVAEEKVKMEVRQREREEKIAERRKKREEEKVAEMAEL
jgi:predicted heme/steroid binding protein